MVIKRRELSDVYGARDVADTLLYYTLGSSVLGVVVGFHPMFSGRNILASIAFGGAMFYATVAYEFRAHVRIKNRLLKGGRK